MTGGDMRLLQKELVLFFDRGYVREDFNFGSLNLDFVYQVEHLVLPGETIASSGYQVNCGGKGLNQSIALARAGAKVCHAGKIGSDGLMLKTLLESEYVNTQHILVAEEKTGHAIIQVDDVGSNSLFCMTERTRP
jgi:hypothetical protein